MSSSSVNCEPLRRLVWRLGGRHPWAQAGRAGELACVVRLPCPRPSPAAGPPGGCCGRGAGSRCGWGTMSSGGRWGSCLQSGSCLGVGAASEAGTGGSEASLNVPCARLAAPQLTPPLLTFPVGGLHPWGPRGWGAQPRSQGWGGKRDQGAGFRGRRGVRDAAGMGSRAPSPGREAPLWVGIGAQGQSPRPTPPGCSSTDACRRSGSALPEVERLCLVRTPVTCVMDAVGQARVPGA